MTETQCLWIMQRESYIAPSQVRLQAVEIITSELLLYSWCLPAPVCGSAVQQPKNGQTCSFFHCLNITALISLTLCSSRARLDCDALLVVARVYYVSASGTSSPHHILMFDHDLMFFKPEFCNFLHLRLVIKQVISPLQVQYKSVFGNSADGGTRENQRYKRFFLLLTPRYKRF